MFQYLPNSDESLTVTFVMSECYLYENESLVDNVEAFS